MQGKFCTTCRWLQEGPIRPECIHPSLERDPVKGDVVPVICAKRRYAKNDACGPKGEQWEPKPENKRHNTKEG